MATVIGHAEAVELRDALSALLVELDELPAAWEYGSDLWTAKRVGEMALAHADGYACSVINCARPGCDTDVAVQEAR